MSETIFHKDLVGADLHVNKLHEDTHRSGGTDALSHNNLASLLGGIVGEYYHLTSAEYSTFGNISNTYLKLDQTTQQTITASPILNWGAQNRIPYYSATKTLTDSANLTYDGTTETIINDALGTGQTVNALSLQNTTLATEGAPNQYSPRLYISGNSWDTNALISKTLAYAFQIRTTSANTPYATLYLQRYRNGAWTDVWGVDSWGQYKAILNYNNSSITDATSPTFGFRLTADGSATVSVDTASPSLLYYSSGWKSDGGGASQYMSIAMENVPEGGVLSPVGVHRIYYATNSSSPVRTNELYRLQWGSDAGKLGAYFNYLKLAGYTFNIKGNTDDSLIFTDGANDRVGIGKNNPATKLDVSGSITASVNGIFGTLTLGSGSIIDSSGAISFGDENLFTTGTLGAGAITGTSIIKSGGTSSQFLKADGSVDSNTYLTAESDTVSVHINGDNISGVETNDILMYDGTNFVAVPEGTTFAYSVLAFSDGQSTPQLIGSGVWKAVGALTFTVTYVNGPPTSAHIDKTAPDWSSDLTLTNPFASVVSTEAVNYPASPGTITFSLHTAKNTETDTETHGVSFYNYIYYGISTKTDTYTEADIEGLANSTISNTKGRTITITASTDEYIMYALPTRLGTVTFTVGGFEGGFESPETVSVTNSAGFTENYYIYRSSNSNLGSTTVVVT